METEETLRFLGFRAAVAAIIFKQWRSQIGASDDLLDFTGEWLNDRNVDATCEDNGWARVLDFVGINKSTKAAIMDPQFSNIRLTKAVSAWLQEIILTRWNHKLSELNSQHSSNQIKPANTQSNESSFDDPMDDKDLKDNYRVLWAAAPVHDVQDMWDEDLLRDQPDKSFLLDPLLSRGPTDYSFRPDIFYYFTPQVQVAQQFAEFREKCMSPALFCLVRIVIPKAILERPIIKLEHPSRDFRDVVWYARSRRKILPPIFRRINAGEIFEGDIVKAAKKPLESYKGPSSVQAHNVLRVVIDGEEVPAKQVAILAKSLQGLIEMNSHVEIRKWTNPDEKY